jgi:hypothetical protein
MHLGSVCGRLYGHGHLIRRYFGRHVSASISVKSGTLHSVVWYMIWSGAGRAAASIRHVKRGHHLYDSVQLAFVRGTPDLSGLHELFIRFGLFGIA